MILGFDEGTKKHKTDIKMSFFLNVAAVAICAAAAAVVFIFCPFPIATAAILSLFILSLAHFKLIFVARQNINVSCFHFDIVYVIVH